MELIMVRLGIVGTGNWAHTHVKAYKTIRGVKVAACCDILKTKAQAFASRYEINSVYTDWRRMFDEAGLDAISVVTNDSTHAEITVAAAKKGLHVLCEKPLATNVPDAQWMVRSAKKHRIINMINLAHRCSALQKARQLVQAGDAGDIIHLEAAYLQSWLSSNVFGDWRKNKTWIWRLSTQSGSNGVLADLGCHILDFATYVAGDISKLYCKLATFDKGIGCDCYKGYKLDANDSAIITTLFKNGALGTIHASRWATGHRNTLYLSLYGTKGGLRIYIDAGDGYDKLMVSVKNDIHRARWKTLSCGSQKDNYHRFIESIKTGVNDTPTFKEGARIQKYLEKCELSDKLKRQVNV